MCCDRLDYVHPPMTFIEAQGHCMNYDDPDTFSQYKLPVFETEDDWQTVVEELLLPKGSLLFYKSTLHIKFV